MIDDTRRCLVSSYVSARWHAVRLLICSYLVWCAGVQGCRCVVPAYPYYPMHMILLNPWDYEPIALYLPIGIDT